MILTHKSDFLIETPSERNLLLSVVSYSQLLQNPVNQNKSNDSQRDKRAGRVLVLHTTGLATWHHTRGDPEHRVISKS